MRFTRVFAFGVSTVLLGVQASYAQVDKCIRSPGTDYSYAVNTSIQTISQSERKIEKNLQDFRAYLELAASLDNLCQFDESLEKYNYVVKQADDKQLTAKAYIGIGYVMRRKRKSEEASVAFQKAIQLSGDQGELAADAYMAIGQGFEIEKPEEAVAAYRKAVSLRKNPDRWHFVELVSVLKSQNRLEEVLNIYQQQLTKTPDDPDAVDNSGELLIEMGRYSDAESLYRKYLSISYSSIHIDPVRIYMRLGNSLFKQGKRAAALDTYRRAIAKFQPGQGTDVCSSSGTMSWRSYSEQLVKQDFYDLAIALCRREESGFPPGASHANYIGEILLKQGKLNEALVEFKRAVRLSPNDKKAQVNLNATGHLIKQR